MANPVCTAASLVTDAVCYHQPNISFKYQQALLLYAKVLELAAIGGTDYSAVLTSTLITDALQLVCGINEEQREAAYVNIAFLNATTAGASVPATLALKMDAVKCLAHVPLETMQKMDLLLTCKLGVHKAYDQ